MNYRLFITLVGSFSVSIAVASGGGAGARGGGTGILCDGWTTPLLLEEYELKNSPTIDGFPLETRAIESWLKARLALDPTLAERVIQKWKLIGKFSSWEQVSRDHEGSFESEDVSIFQKLNNILTVHGAVSVKEPEWFLIQDDFSVLPSGCRKVQLSGIRDSKPYRIYTGEISDRTKRLTEIHEALYLVGMEHYEHKLPIQSRRLLQAMILSDVKEPQKAIALFTKLPRQSERFGDHYRMINRVLILTSGTGSCPLMMSFSYDGEKQRTVSLEREGNRLRIQVRHPEPLRNTAGILRVFEDFANGDWGGNERVPALRFPDESRPIRAGYSAVLSFESPGEFVLALQYWKTARGYGSRVPKPENSVSRTRAADEYCLYSTWVPERGLDEANLVKIWNQILLGQPQS